MLVAASWLGAAVLTGTIAWRAVAVLDADTPRTGVLSTQQVHEKLASAQAAAQATTPAPTPTDSPTPTAEPTTPEPTQSPTATQSPTPTTHPSPSATKPAPTTPAPTEVTRTWPVTGGTVSAACTGQAIRKVYATPQDGWTVETGASGPDVVEVELHRGEQETKVTARCVDGVPVPTVSTDSGDEHSSEHDG